jgi:proteasome accessory factor PafA2
MSIPKVVGIEQEYAIKLKGDSGLTAHQASCLLINAYARKIGLREPGRAMLWDYAHETPYQDFRGPLYGKSARQEITSAEDNLLINAVLANGARLYTDHAHPEYSTPECVSAAQAVACDKAGEIILQEAVKALREDLPEYDISLFKNNTDHQGQSYGCHENYLMDAEAHQECLVRDPDKALKTLVPFLVSRQVLAGAGKVGGWQRETNYQISQRADFLECVFGLETTHHRPLINTRQEYHADPERFRRLHLVLGDANMCEFAGFLKLGTTQLVLMMLEDDFIRDDFRLKDPLAALKAISANYEAEMELADARKLTAVDLQQNFLGQAAAYRQTGAADHLPQVEEILTGWHYVLEGLRRLRISDDFHLDDDPLELRRRLDWVLKLWLLNRCRRDKGLGWDSPLLRVLDLQYHHIDPQEGIFYHLQTQGFTERMLEDDDIARFTRQAPPDTRAYFRGRCIEQFPDELCLVNWEVVGFDHGKVRRLVPLLNPLKGTREQFAEIFAESRNSRELLKRLT